MSSFVNLFMEDTKVDYPTSVNADNQTTEVILVGFPKSFGD
jgi:hypothetical protein